MKVPALVRMLSTTPVLLGPTTVDRFICQSRGVGAKARLQNRIVEGGGKEMLLRNQALLIVKKCGCFTLLQPPISNMIMQAGKVACAHLYRRELQHVRRLRPRQEVVVDEGLSTELKEIMCAWIRVHGEWDRA